MERTLVARFLGPGLAVLASGLLALRLQAQPADERAETERRAKAAEQFARALAPENGETFARAFRVGFEAAHATSEGRGSKSRGRSAGTAGVESDPRYQQNLQSMIGADKDKVWGGQRTPKGAFPDVVAVQGSGYICSGTLVARRVVLTAAHCHCDGANKTVTFGDSTRDPAARVIEVLRSEAWIRCDQDEREGDLALLFLKEDAPVTPRGLAAPEWIDKATEVHVVGFGRTEDPLAEPTGIKREVDVPIATTNCAGQVSLAGGAVDDSAYYACRSRGELVAGSPLLDRDSCNGDSGGPIFVKGPEDKLYLAGATSRAVVRFGLRPCGDGGIYARADGDGLAWMKAKGVSPTVGTATAGTGWAPTGGKQLARLSQEPPTPATAEATRARVHTWVRSHASGPVTGALRSRPDGTFVLVPEAAPEIAIPLSNSRELSSTVVGLPVRVSLESADGAFIAKSIALEAVAALADATRTTQSYPEVERVASRLGQASERAFRSGAMGPGEALSDLIASSRELEREIASAITDLPADKQQERAVLRESLRDTRTTTKALYLRSDIYRPEAYKRIFDNSRGSTAIAVRGVPTPYCSGFLVAKDAILTARHCLRIDPRFAEEYDASDLEVRFNYEVNLAGAEEAKDIYPVKAIETKGVPVFAGGPDLDFALLRLHKNAEGKMAGEKWPVQCLSTTALRRDDALYVIGHPQGNPRSVHDNAFVYFPFLASRREFNYLKAVVEAELLGPPRDPAFDERLQQFTDSYRKRTTTDGLDVYENFSRRWGRQPTVATDADTFHGNSGSPVYSRQHHRVVGILFAGEDDLATPWIPGWRAHEAVLPVTQVIDQLDSGLPAWRRLENLCVND